jgi:putative membrane protein
MTAADVLALFPSTFMSFLVAFGLGAVFWVAGLVIVSFATPHRELLLLRAGNLPCAIAFGGKAIGMVLPIAAVARAAASPLDQVIWCIVAVAVQLVAHLVLSTLLQGRLKAEIEADEVGGAAVFIAFMQIGAGILNNAVMSG